QFTVVSGWTVSQYRTVFDTLTFGNTNNLVVRVALVGTLEFVERIVAGGALVFHDGYQVCSNLGYYTWFQRNGRISGVNGDWFFHPGTNQWRLGFHERDSLTLHIGAHERTVGIVMFQEWNQRSCSGNHLAWRNVHIVNVGRFGEDRRTVTAAVPRHAAFVSVVAVFVHYRIGLSDLHMQLVISGEVFNDVADFIVNVFAVRSFNKTELVDAAVSSH